MKAVSIMSGGLAVLMSVPLPPAGGQEAAGVRTVRASASPLLSIGGGSRGADSLYDSFHAVSGGAIRLPDSSIVVMAGGHYEVRRFGPDGTHLWSRGRRGEGPVEFEMPKLLPTCSSDNRIVIHDHHSRITILNNDGELVEDYKLRLGDRTPYSTIECSPSGRMAFTLYARDDEMPSKPGPHRWSMDMAYADGEGSAATVFRSGIPGTDRQLYFRDGFPVSELPLTWGRDVALAAADDGVWIGTGDSHEIEFADWAGTTVRRISWAGSADLEVTQEDVDLERSRLYKLYEQWGVAGWRQRFDDMWAQDEPALPARFPSHNTIMVAADGLVWVKHFRPPRLAEHHWVAFNDEGARVADMFLPVPFSVQQIGADWVLVVVTDDLGGQSVAVYGLVQQ